MKSISIALLALAVVACRSTDDKDDHWPSDTTSTSSQPQPRSDNSGYASGNVQGRTTPAASEASSRALSADDKKFVTQAAQAGMFEVRSSRLALEKNVSAPTREFAQMMIDDHGKANRDLDAIVHRKGATTPDVLDSDHERKLDALDDLDGREFERKYRDEQKNGHDQAIRLFERCSKECDDPDLRAFANRMLPKLREHRKHLDEHPME